jgi:hypothetical protein
MEDNVLLSVLPAKTKSFIPILSSVPLFVHPLKSVWISGLCTVDWIWSLLAKFKKMAIKLHDPIRRGIFRSAEILKYFLWNSSKTAWSCYSIFVVARVFMWHSRYSDQNKGWTSEFDSRQGKFSKSSIPTLLPSAFCSLNIRVKKPERETNYYPVWSVKVKDEWNF